MPYALTFRKPVLIADREQYINECCIGGDVVLDRLLPSQPRLLLGSKVQDTPELEGLRELVTKELEAWPVADLRIERVDAGSE